MLIFSKCKHCGQSICNRDEINWIHLTPKLRYCSRNGVALDTTAEPVV